MSSAIARHGRAALSATALGLLIYHGTVLPAEWSVVPAVKVLETYTSNVFLSSSNEKSDAVTTVTPAVSIRGEGARLKLDADYFAHMFAYANNSDENRVHNYLNARVTVEAVDNFFFIDAIAKSTQEYISPFAARPSDNGSINNNLVEVHTYGVSPYIQGVLSGGITYRLRNDENWITSKSDQLSDVQISRWTGRMDSPIRLFGWALDYANTATDFEGQSERHEALYRGIGFYQPSSTWRLSASGGYESNNYATTFKNDPGAIYGLGTSWAASPRTSASVQWEHRSFGSSYLANVDSHSRLTAWHFGCSRRISNYPIELLTLRPGNNAAMLDAIFSTRVPDRTERIEAIRQFLQSTETPRFSGTSLAFFTEDIFLQEQVVASMALLGKQNSLTLTTFRIKSTPIEQAPNLATSGAFKQGDVITQTGLRANFSHKLTPFTNLNLMAARTYSKVERFSQGTSTQDEVRATVSKTLSPKTDASVGMHFTQLTADNTGTESYHEAALFIALGHRF